jgi:ubiquinone/menaquinone biosynthesis C-methylase UbiE
MEEAKAYYDEKSASYDEQFKMLYFRVYDAITWKYLEPYVPRNPDALVLDAGGGTGRWATRMAKTGCKVVLMDTSEGMLTAAAKRIEAENLQQQITIKKGNIAKTGYADETFDMVLCEHALFLFKDPIMVVNEFRRVLKKKARLIVSVHNRYVQTLCRLERPSPEDTDNALRILRCERYDSMTKNGNVKIYTWTPDEFRLMLERSGFKVEKMVGKGTTMPLRISKDLFMKKEYSEELFKKILELEFDLCEKPDALALAGHLQAIACKT